MTRVGISLLVLLAAGTAAAQPRSPSEAREALLGARLALEEEAPGRAFEMARLARALDPALSVEAYTLMGRAQSELGHPVLAHRFFRRALALAPPEARARLLARMQLARAELGIVRVDVQPGGAALFVDGEPAELERGETLLLLRPGTHELTATLEGHETRRSSFHVASGSHRVMHVVLEEGDPSRVRAIPRPARRPPGRGWLTGNLMLLGLGAAGAGVAGGFLSDAHPSIADELQFEVGLGLGLVLGASANMMLSEALGGYGATSSSSASRSRRSSWGSRCRSR